MKRLIDATIAGVGLLVMAVPMLVIAVLVKLTSKGPVLHWSDRVGKDNRIFRMPKFRTMRTDTPQMATHLLADSSQWITPVGRLLRKTSLDELPQLWCILVGEMCFVGPRPALFNQDDLAALRTEKGVHRLVPGITGWAQANGRDEIPIPEKVELDAYYLEHRGFWFDMKILWLTVVNVMRGKDVSH